MAWTSRLSRMSAAPGMVRACARDRQGGATRAPLPFLLDWLSTPPAAEPEAFRACPVLMVHPADDRWTAAALSTRFLARVAAPTTLVLLTYAGHLPVEQPGLEQLRDAVRRILDEVACGTTSR